jgi:hypothetical protein
MFNLPKRTGPTEHDWGTSIEPLVSQEDIQLDGRTLTLHATVKSDRVDAYKSACVACKALSFEHDSFDVVCRDEITVQSVGEYSVVITKFRQNNFELKPITITPSPLWMYNLDKFNLQRDFGIYISKSNNLLDTAKRIDVSTTEFYTRANHRGTRDITLNCSMLGSNFADLYKKITQFQSVMMQPGIRILDVRNIPLNVYFKDGMTVDVVSDQLALFSLKATCV